MSATTMSEMDTVGERLKEHRGVGVIPTNESRSLFYIQQKDEHYPTLKFRLGYSFFGGAIGGE